MTEIKENDLIEVDSFIYRVVTLCSIGYKDIGCYKFDIEYKNNTLVFNVDICCDDYYSSLSTVKNNIEKITKVYREDQKGNYIKIYSKENE